MKFSRLFSSMLVGSVAVGATIIACGGSSPKKPDGKVTVIDSPGSGSQGSCAAAATYSPTFNGSSQSAVNFPASGSGSTASPHSQDWEGVLDMKTILDIELYAGYGGFGSGDIKNGTYTISGADAAFSTCGICGLLLADVTVTGSGSSAMLNVGTFYSADSGSITLTSVTGTLSGSLSNVHFIHVNKTSQGGPADPPAADSCASVIASGSFSATLQQGSAAFTGDTYEGQMESGQPIRIHLRNHK